MNVTAGLRKREGRFEEILAIRFDMTEREREGILAFFTALAYRGVCCRDVMAMN